MQYLITSLFRHSSISNITYIPNSIKEIRLNAFSGCNIGNLYFSGNADEWASIKFTSNIFGQNDFCSTTYLYFQNKKVENLKFNNILKINQYAFYGVKELKTIEFSDNLIEIGNGAFSLCEDLEFVNFNNCQNLTTINSHCFYRCSNLKEANFADCSNLEIIYNYAFSNCSSLTNVYLYSNSTLILSDVFNACPNCNVIYTV